VPLHSSTAAAAKRPRNEQPVAAVAPTRLYVASAQGAGYAPVFRSLPDSADATVERIVVLLHGRLRDADAYLLSGQRALAAADVDPARTLLIVPQFLASADLSAHALPPDTLHWDWTGWMGGGDALGPAPLSSFDVLDAVLAQCLQRQRYPRLRQVVVAGHSGGAQVAHRHAIVGRGAAALAAAGLSCRYVVANPSSYVYFDTLRPNGRGGFAPADQHACPGVDIWKYGVHQPPRYAQHADFVQLEQAYAASDVVYLLGELDHDPAHQALDRSCAARAQGPHRLARGLAYFDYLSYRHAELAHRCWRVPGVGHHGDAMFKSAAGLSALFDAQARVPDPGWDASTAAQGEASGAGD